MELIYSINQHDSYAISRDVSESPRPVALLKEKLAFLRTEEATTANAAYRLDIDDTTLLQKLLPQLEHVKSVLENAENENPENAGYIQDHHRLADRAIALINGMVKVANTFESVPHVFISYIRENKKEIFKLRHDLEKYGVNVWLDRDKLEPGVLWKPAIRKAIKSGHYFLAVFSKEYSERHQTYMNEELILAVHELRKRPRDRAWFIPVLLSDCQLPDLEIGPGETLEDIQYVDLSSNRATGLRRLVAVLTRPNNVI